MTNQKNNSETMEEMMATPEIEAFLPITARPLMLRVFLCAAELIADSSLPKKILSTLRESNGTENSGNLLENVLEQGLFWPQKLIQEAAQNSEKWDQFKVIAAPLLDDSVLTENPINKKYIDSFSHEVVDVFGSNTQDINEKDSLIPLASLVFAEIIELKLKEDSYLKNKSQLSYVEITEALNPRIDSIVESYLLLKNLPNRIKSFEQKITKSLESSEGGKNRWANKKAVFSDFISWSLNLEAPTMFKWPKHAAEYYLNHALKDRPLTKDQVSSVNLSSIRRMCEELQSYCTANEISNPFNNRN